MSGVTVEATLPDGRTVTSSVSPETVKAALAVINGKGDTRQNEMFSTAETGQDEVQAVAAGQLRALIERIERLEEDKAQVSSDIKDIYAEAKGTGFCPKTLRSIIRLRKKEASEREEEEAILDLYKSALGMV